MNSYMVCPPHLTFFHPYCILLLYLCIGIKNHKLPIPVHSPGSPSLSASLCKSLCSISTSLEHLENWKIIRNGYFLSKLHFLEKKKLYFSTELLCVQQVHILLRYAEPGVLLPAAHEGRSGVFQDGVRTRVSEVQEEEVVVGL